MALRRKVGQTVERQVASVEKRIKTSRQAKRKAPNLSEEKIQPNHLDGQAVTEANDRVKGSTILIETMFVG